MADNRTMAQMLQAPIEGYEDAIVVPPINANNFELKQPLINLVQSNKFTANDAVLKNVQNQGQNLQNQMANVTSLLTRLLEEPSIPLVPSPDVSKPQKEPEQNPETSTEKVQNPNLENTAHVPSSGEEDSIFIEIPKPKAKETFPRSSKIRKFLIPCALQELNRTSALADSGASINLLPHSIYKKLELEALTPTRMTLELANHFVVVNFEPDPRVPIILGRPFLRTAKALIDLYEEKLTLKNDPFSGSTTTHSSEPISYSSHGEERVIILLRSLMNLLLLIRYHGNDIQLLKKDLHEENFQEDDVEIKNPTSDPLHHEFAGEPSTLPARNDRKFEEYLSLMTVLNEISTSQGNFHQNSVIESLPMSPILVEDSEPTQEEIDILLVPPI
ncbi:reverse transcriptase domain-containing protein [Tanacetum coccineum]